MPADFEKCISDGGKVVTKKLGKSKYVKLCKDKSGKWHRGEVHSYKKVLKKNYGRK